MEKKMDKKEKIIEKEIVIKFKIKAFNTLYELDDNDKPTNKPAYEIENMISDIENHIDKQVIGDLLEILSESAYCEEIEFIDDLVKMDVLVNEKLAKQFTRDHECSNCPHINDPKKREECCENRNYWTKRFESCEKVWKNKPLPKIK